MQLQRWKSFFCKFDNFMWRVIDFLVDQNKFLKKKFFEIFGWHCKLQTMQDLQN
jgi:hypothetical protein